MSLHGHAWTVLPHLARRVQSVRRPAAAPWRLEQPDPRWGSITLSGWLSDPCDSRELVVLVHGLGGSSDSSYLRLSAEVVARAGLASLRLNLRGADLSGTDIYHSGLSQDLGKAIASPELEHYARIYVVGYSIGGHVALHYALGERDPRVRGLVAICAPLDLSLTARAFDTSGASAYRHYVLSSLKRCYRAYLEKRAKSSMPRDVLAVRAIRAWDELVVAPRFGFRDAEDYYALTSVGPRLGGLTLPSLYVGAAEDPMVPKHTLSSALAGASPALDVRFSKRGGHLGFPRQFRLGEAASPGIEAQVLSWLRRRP